MVTAGGKPQRNGTSAAPAGRLPVCVSLIRASTLIGRCQVFREDAEVRVLPGGVGSAQSGHHDFELACGREGLADLCPAKDSVDIDHTRIHLMPLLVAGPLPAYFS